MATNMTTEAKPDVKVQVARSTAREQIKAFNFEGVAEKITRPMLVIAAKEDRITRWQDGELTGGCFGNSSILGSRCSKADSYHLSSDPEGLVENFIYFAKSGSRNAWVDDLVSFPIKLWVLPLNAKPYRTTPKFYSYIRLDLFRQKVVIKKYSSMRVARVFGQVSGPDFGDKRVKHYGLYGCPLSFHFGRGTAMEKSSHVIFPCYNKLGL